MMLAVQDGANPKVLDQAVQDFAFHYKAKAEHIGKEIRLSIQDQPVAGQVGHKMMRTICFKYSKLAELCKQAQSALQIPTNNQVLLDLTNSSLRIQ